MASTTAWLLEITPYLVCQINVASQILSDTGVRHMVDLARMRIKRGKAGYGGEWGTERKSLNGELG